MFFLISVLHSKRYNSIYPSAKLDSRSIWSCLQLAPPPKKCFCLGIFYTNFISRLDQVGLRVLADRRYKFKNFHAKINSRRLTSFTYVEVEETKKCKFTFFDSLSRKFFYFFSVIFFSCLLVRRFTWKIIGVVLSNFWSRWSVKYSRLKNKKHVFCPLVILIHEFVLAGVCNFVGGKLPGCFYNAALLCLWLQNFN